MEKIINVNGFLLKVDFSKNKRIEVIGTKRKGIEIIKKFEEGHLGSTYLIDFYGKKAVLKFPITYQLRNYDLIFKAFLFSKILRRKGINNVPKVYEGNFIKIDNHHYLLQGKIPFIITKYIEGQKLEEKEVSNEIIEKFAKLVAKIHKETITNSIKIVATKVEYKKKDKKRTIILRLKSIKKSIKFLFVNKDVHYYSLYKPNKEYLKFSFNLLKKLESKRDYKGYFVSSLSHGDLSFNNLILDNRSNKMYLIDPSLKNFHIFNFYDIAKVYRYFRINNNEEKFDLFLEKYLELFNPKLDKEKAKLITKLFHIRLSTATLYFLRNYLKLDDNEFLEKVENIVKEDIEEIKNKESTL